MAQRARHGFDRQIIGNVLARHRQIDRVASGFPFRHFEKERHDAFVGVLDEQQDIVAAEPNAGNSDKVPKG